DGASWKIDSCLFNPTEFYSAGIDASDSIWLLTLERTIVSFYNDSFYQENVSQIYPQQIVCDSSGEVYFGRNGYDEVNQKYFYRVYLYKHGILDSLPDIPLLSGYSLYLLFVNDSNQVVAHQENQLFTYDNRGEWSSYFIPAFQYSYME